MAITPWLMRRNECFAVTIPESAQDDSRFVAFKKRYALIVLAFTAVCSAMMAAYCGTVDAAEVNSMPFVWMLCAFTLVIVLVPFALMLYFRKKVQAVKAAEGWAAKAQQTAVVIAEEDAPRAVPLAWNLLYMPIILLTAVIGVVGYPYMPDMIPMHADFSGNVNDWAPKSPGVMAFPVLIEAFLATCMILAHWSIARSKRPANPGAPATSAFAYGMFARAQSVFLLIMGLVLSAVIGVGFMLAALEIVTLGQMAVVVIAASILAVVGALVLSVVYGQAGSRLFKRMQAMGDGDAQLTPEMLADDDEHWKLGIFYVNRDDPSIFLPERFGIGWTINLGRPAAWAIVVGLTVLTIAFVAVTFALVG